MILMYHHIGAVKNENWVSEEKFASDMRELARGKRDVVTLDRYDPAHDGQAVITFDDGNRDILRFAVPLLREMKFSFEVFLVGLFQERAFLGKSDAYCTCSDIDVIRASGGRLQYHTWSHSDLTTLEEDALEAEIAVPDWMRTLDPDGFRFLAYPFCRYNEAVLRATRLQYCGGVSGKGLGCDTEHPYAMDRIKVMQTGEGWY